MTNPAADRAPRFPPKPVARVLHSILSALWRSQETGNTLWAQRHRQALEALCDRRGLALDYAGCGDDRLVFVVYSACLNEHGYFVGTAEFRVTVRPSFAGYDVRARMVSGPRSGRGEREGVADQIAHSLEELVTRAEECFAYGVPDDSEAYGPAYGPDATPKESR